MPPWARDNSQTGAEEPLRADCVDGLGSRLGLQISLGIFTCLEWSRWACELWGLCLYLKLMQMNGLGGPFSDRLFLNERCTLRWRKFRSFHHEMREVIHTHMQKGMRAIASCLGNCRWWPCHVAFSGTTCNHGDCNLDANPCPTPTDGGQELSFLGRFTHRSFF